MSKQAQEKTGNLLDLQPQHNVRWEVSEDQRVALIIPRIGHPFLRKLFNPLMKNPDLRIFLDEYGSWVWQLIDGKKTVYQLGELLEGHFGEATQPVFERLGLFINQLARNRFVLLLNNRQS
ncbi:MAG TPA: PqqD family protein [bacterium]|jgi:hypothetical protein|nr:PqqD family protein [bacterium]HNT64551.1 PqqD family protein [bacterium]HOX84606.1 PqqD family protein [bacterium]HPG45329.1 PqqD family protein [bacterium]HPM98952.1 PqqD family protein [bacterium]